MSKRQLSDGPTICGIYFSCVLNMKEIDSFAISCDYAPLISPCLHANVLKLQ